jgi:manganese transport protein
MAGGEAVRQETTEEAEMSAAPLPSVASAPAAAPSLNGYYASVPVPPARAGFWRQWRAFAGPALLVSVGYMDPGNWATDLKAGALYHYGLLWVVALSSGMAIVMQVLAARLGIVTGKDLAQACRDYCPAWTRWPNWLACEVAIAACDLAELLGSALALHLLFHLPLLWAVLLTALDVLLLLALQGWGVRWLEAIVLVLVTTIALCFFIEIFLLPPTRPDFRALGWALCHPSLAEQGMVVLAIGIIGATVMPHNLYLHSSLVQSRRFGNGAGNVRRALRFFTLDTVVALGLAFLVNAAILVLAALVFYGRQQVLLPDGRTVVFGEETDWIQDAYLTLAPLLGTSLASTLFAVALLASGQSSTLTGTLAGQVVMEGFLRWRLAPWLRRLLTRLTALAPAIAVIAWRGEEHITDLLVLSQVVLALQLPLAMFPLVYFTSRRKYMGRYANGWLLASAGWLIALLITALDLYGLPESLAEAGRLLTGD